MARLTHRLKRILFLPFLCLVLFTLYLLYFEKLRENRAQQPASTAIDPAPSFIFGLISDLQFADNSDGVNLDNGRPRFYRDSLRKLGAAVADWRRAGVEMVIDIGDVLDARSGRRRRQLADLDALELQLRNLTVPYYALLGNHDLDNFDFAGWRRLSSSTSGQRKIRRTMATSWSSPPRPSDFRFSFSPHPNLRFIMLNSYAEGVLGNNSATASSSEAWRLLRRHNPNTNPYSAEGLGVGAAARRWVAHNAALGAEQLVWLGEELSKAEAGGEKVIVFAHVPLHPEVIRPVSMFKLFIYNFFNLHTDNFHLVFPILPVLRSP